MMDKPPMDRLLEIGFERAGEWSLEGEEPTVDLERYANAANVLYAFISHREVLYIGRSGRSLRLRMSGYENGGPPRSMREKNRERIIAMLLIEQPVLLYAMPDPGNLHYGSFRVNLAAGLQHSLIEALAPPWNTPPARRPQRHAVRRRETPAPRPTGAARPTNFDDIDNTYTDRTVDCPSYRFLLGYMYLENGFFNVPMRYSRLFGRDREKIKILCGADKQTVYGHIDRASNTNASPRVLGGPLLKSWFEVNAGLNHPIDIDILAPNAIWLRNPGAETS